MLITFSGTESATWFAVLKWLQRVPKNAKIEICCSYQHQKVSFGKNDEVATKHKCTSSIIIGIILLRLYDNLFFSSRKESKELMLKETAAPLNGFFYFDFLGERGV